MYSPLRHRLRLSPVRQLLARVTVRAQQEAWDRRRQRVGTPVQAQRTPRAPLTTNENRLLEWRPRLAAFSVAKPEKSQYTAMPA